MRPLAANWLVKALAVGTGLVYAAARLKSTPSARRVVQVNGEGEVDCAPDFARLRVAVRTRDAVAKKASAQLQGKIAAVLEALVTQAQVPKADLQTTNLSIRQERSKPEGESKYRTEYVAYSELTVKVREIEKLGLVLDVANDAGIDELEDLQFDIQDSRGPKRRALALAVQDAKSQAQVLAKSAGMRLGAVLEISDGPDYSMDRSGGMLAAASGYGSAIASGTIVVHAQAHLKFELLPLETSFFS